MTAQKILLVVVISIVSVGGFLLSQPAQVVVGGEKIVLKESVIEVVVLDTIGDIIGFGSCPITDLSYYWVDFTSLKFDEGRGVLFSSYAVDALLKMPLDRAHEIAQKAFQQSQDYWCGDNNKNQLFYPLEIL